jgi:hypothetical protein
MSKIMKAMRSFHEDEAGLEALQVVMIVAIAALFLLVVKYLWDNYLYSWVQTLIKNISGWSSSDANSGQ